MKYLLILFLGILCFPFVSQAQGPRILPYPNIFRYQGGGVLMNIKDMDHVEDRMAYGIRQRIEIRALSALLYTKVPYLVVTDGLFMDANVGMLRSTPLYTPQGTESNFSYKVQLGYDLMIGFENKHFGISGGKSFRWFMSTIGGTELPGGRSEVFTSPYVASVNFRPGYSEEFRLVITGWYNPDPSLASYGYRVDIPLHSRKRIWLYGGMSALQTDAAPYTFPVDKVTPANWVQWSAGIRIGGLH